MQINNWESILHVQSELSKIIKIKIVALLKEYEFLNAWI